MPHRQIAEWLGVSYDAATKRIWRLKRRLQSLAAEHYARISGAHERRELERLFRRSGIGLPGTSGVVRAVGPDNAEETQP